MGDFFKDQVALVTGAASDIGAALAQAQASTGVRSCTHPIDVRKAQALADLPAHVCDLHGAVQLLAARALDVLQRCFPQGHARVLACQMRWGDAPRHRLRGSPCARQQTGDGHG